MSVSLFKASKPFIGLEHNHFTIYKNFTSSLGLVQRRPDDMISSIMLSIKVTPRRTDLFSADPLLIWLHERQQKIRGVMKKPSVILSHFSFVSDGLAK